MIARQSDDCEKEEKPMSKTLGFTGQNHNKSLPMWHTRPFPESSGELVAGPPATDLVFEENLEEGNRNS